MKVRKKKIIRRGPPPVLIRPLKYEVFPLYIEKLVKKYENGEKIGNGETGHLIRFYRAPFRIIRWFLDRKDYFMKNFPKCPSCGNDINMCYYPPFNLQHARWMPKCRDCILAEANIEECKKRLMEVIDKLQCKTQAMEVVEKFLPTNTKQKIDIVRVSDSYMIPLVAYYCKPALQIFYHYQIGDYELKKIPKCKRCGRSAYFFITWRKKYGYKEYCNVCFWKTWTYNMMIRLGYAYRIPAGREERIRKKLMEYYGSHYFSVVIRTNSRKFTMKNLESHRNYLKISKITWDKMHHDADELEFKRTATFFRKKGVENPETHAALWLKMKNDKVWWENAILHEQLTVADLASIFNVSKDTIRKILRKYDLTTKKIAQTPEEKLKNKGNMEFIDSIVKYDGIF